MRRQSVSAALMVLGFGPLACGDARPTVALALSNACVTCHGGADNQSGAPPFDTHGRTDSSLPSVGAHTAHVQAGKIWNGSDCDACHVKPVDVNSPGHLDGQVTIAWGPLATLGGLSPQYDPSNYGCSATYCHGGFPGGNANSVPVWTKVGQAQAACGTCHGNPNATPSTLPANHAPLASGSTNATCNVCHAQTVKPDGSIDVAGGKHVNGAVDVDPAAIHPKGWLDTTSPSFHGVAAASSPGTCLRCHTVNPPAQVTTVVCNGCHTLMGDPITSLAGPQP